MSEICTCCNGTGRARPITVDDLRDWCRDNAHVVFAGDLVRTEAAAALLDLEPQSLRADRMNGARVPFVKRGRRCYYRLDDLIDVDLR